MTAIKLAWLELRRFRGPLRGIVPVLLCLVPLLYGALYLWANWDPYGQLDKIPVAVVNQDHVAHTKQGRRIDAGDQLVEQLKAKHTFDWRFVDARDARHGLEHGDNYFTITIPPDFSDKLATAPNTRPEQAGISIELNDANNYIAGIMTEVVQPQLQEQINSAAHAAYVRAIYGELSTVRDKLETASQGAHQLVGATNVAEEGATTLASSTARLHQGAATVTDGAHTIGRAAKKLDELSTKLNHSVANALPGAAATAVHTADLAATGTAAVHDGTSTIAGGASRTVADLNTLADRHPELRDDPAFTRATDDAKRVAATASTVDGKAAAAAGNAHQAQRRAKSIQANIGDVQQQVLAANAPIRLLDSGAQTVAGGADGLTRGLDTLQQGAGTMHTAASQAHDGAKQISGVTDDALSQIPPTDPDQVAHAAQVLGTPVHIDRDNLHPAGVYGRGFAPFFFGIALWVFGLFAYLLLRPLNLRALGARVNGWTVAVAGWLPGAALGIIGALVLYGVVDFGLGLDPLHAGLTVLLLAVGAASFVAIDHFLRTALGAPGDVVSLVLLVLQLTSSGGLYPMPTTPGFFQALNPLLPMTYLIDGLRVTISGGLTSHLLRDFGVLVGFGVVFLALTGLVVRRQRVWTVARLHPDVEL